jgi:hypothetical protein
MESGWRGVVQRQAVFTASLITGPNAAAYYLRDGSRFSRSAQAHDAFALLDKARQRGR